MQPTLEPIAKIPLETTPAGDTYGPELAFSPDGTVLYVRQPVVPLDGWDWVRWHAPEMAGVVLLATVVWLVWLTRRVMRRKQELGCVYCRQCNYELTAPIAEEVRAGRAEWLSAEAKCPECGERTRRAPVAGRLRRWRLGPWLMLGMIAIAGAVGVMGSSLTPLRPMEGPTWPVAGIERVARGLAYQKERDRFPTVHRLSRWAMPSGKAMGSLALEHVYGMSNGLISPDGRVSVMGCWDTHGGAQTELVVIDTANGARCAVVWNQSPIAVPNVIGFLADSSKALVQWTSGIPGQEMEAVLEEVDVRTMARRELERVKMRPRLTTTGIEALYPYFLVDPADPERRVLVVFQQDPGGGGVAAEITVLDRGTRKTIAAALTGRSWYPPKLLDRDTLELPLFGVTQDARINLGSEAVSVVPQPVNRVMGRTRDGALEARFVGKMWQIWDAKTETAVATLGTGGGSGSQVVFSPDGRLAASMVVTVKAGAAPGSNRPGDWETKVWVWRVGGE